MTDLFKLRRLKAEDEEAFCIAYQEFKSSADFDFVSHFEEGMPFPELIKRLDDQERGRNLPEGYVPSTFLFAFVGEKLVGRVSIRHKLNDFLRRTGGHIGYGVVPSERRKGFASRMLRESLVVAEALGLEKVLVTCDDTNLPSKKIINNAGGVFEKLSKQRNGLPGKCLYWIVLGS